MTIEKINIPDGDIPGWMKILREGGFSDKEIDAMLSRLNVAYAKGAKIDPMEEELKRIEEHLKAYGKTLNDEEREYMRKSIASRPEFEDFRDKK
ncbi:MAG: hypothetical protein UW30_C0001G0036 [Candidatus Giovannonibacteria bacterium GW2011_GWA2_44_13b]|uniref:Uncharacterized protein n=2 Tax=Candidatus Giovannoniibacteriota TaxID=1752738 RepID=A0A0G1H4H1_9BACT|nr:MAG: hypothetical protein UW30_C0001G0036 [Candidatus Giovannonibacteria bacterium GW2011_GWA2_44_13b]OGF83221.1 MAG: hypothetical protein A2924_02805 [Candidatus Giovannonibacteria bacterium RIFCSPLOWO2_01_FULL_44_16]